MSKILCFSVTTKKERDFFSTALGASATLFEGELQDSLEGITNPEEVEVISSFTGSECNKANLDQFLNLKLIATRSTGYDHVDLEYLNSRGITLCNVPVYGASTVAEHTFALLLAISRRAYQSYLAVQEKMDFSMRGDIEFQGFDLYGKTIGVIGTGNIGRNVISIAHGFGMKVWAYDLHPDPELTEQFGVQWGTSVEQVVKESDIVTIHVPYNKHTHHLFNTKMLHYIQESGIVLLNTSRGEVVETLALLNGLDNGKILYAGLDVLEMEHTLTDEEVTGDDVLLQQFGDMQIKNQTLVGHPRVIVTPHNAFNTTEAIMRIWQTTVDNISAYTSGSPQNTVSNT